MINAMVGWCVSMPISKGKLYKFIWNFEPMSDAHRLVLLDKNFVMFYEVTLWAI